MSTDDPSNMLRDFVYWVRKRRPLFPNPSEAWVSEETLECVAQGVERFLGGETPWIMPKAEKPKRRGRPVDPDTQDLMWKCFYLACVVSEDEEFLPQYCRVKPLAKKGGFDVVAEQLNLSAKSVEHKARIAEKRRETPEGMREYCDWLTNVERTWWFYHAFCVENRELKLPELSESGGVKSDVDALHIRPEEISEIISDAKRRLANKRENSIYRQWLSSFDRRDAIGKSKPLRIEPLSSDDPRAKAMDERRSANGLRNGRTKAGRKRKTSN